MAAVRGEPEHSTLAMSQEGCGAGGGDLAAERQMRISFFYYYGRGWAPGSLMASSGGAELGRETLPSRVCQVPPTALGLSQ